MSISRVCLGFTSYRMETLPYVRKKMQDFECIVLEEPPTPGFNEMLEMEMGIQDYLSLTEFGFPGFAQEQCSLLRELHAKGKEILQIDPFLEELLSIHEFFAAGRTPQEIREGTTTREVYECERVWTAKLLSFYKTTSTDNDFYQVVGAVQDFARADAQKTRMRDEMRSQGLRRVLGSYSDLYVEAGYIHFVLLRDVYRLLPAGGQLETFFSLQSYFRSRINRRQLLGPGDVLTLLYTWIPDYSGPKADLLAAQSLIYNKVVQKEEIQEHPEDFPHSRDELQAINLARSLDFNQCAELYTRIRGLPTDQAQEMAREWVRGTRQ